MTREQTFFTGVLADHLNKRRTASADGLNWNLVLSYAKKHQVEGILYYQCKDFLPPEVRGRMIKLYASTLFYYTNRTKQFEEICKEFAERKISFYTVKGLDVAEFYPIPALRTMGDCDIIVHSHDKKGAHDAMVSLGYANDWHQDVEWTYYKNRLEFEIHDHLLYDVVVNSQISQDFTDLAWEYARKTGVGAAYTLDWNFHFVFLLLHLKKHFLNSGVGFRQFMDLTVVVQRQNLDWMWLKEILQKLEIMKFAEVCCSLCERWFDVKMPLSAELDEAFAEESIEKIFGNGVFGFDDQENKDNAVLNQVDRIGKVKTIIRNIFPSYQNMRYVPYYSFLNNRRWLLPVAWLYRFARCLRNGKSENGLNLVKIAAHSDEKREQRQAMLYEWGLSEK